MRTNRNRLPDLFDSYRESDLFDRRPILEVPTPDYVRAHMQKILDEVRGASRLPWDQSTVRAYENIFPQMSKWLPPEEAEILIVDFNSELARLKSLS